ncbi:MAG: glycosyltransferase family 2 protein [Bacteroidota bacterium]
MPKVTIIVPNYLHAPFLKQRMDSIFNQTFTDYEVIILDDCSSDNSVEILNEYAKHPKVSHFIINDKNSGSPFKQWERGIQLAKGDYIWIAESDDWCELSLLDELVSGALKDENIVVSYCQSQIVLDDMSIRYTSTHSKMSEILDGNEFAAENMLTGNKIFNAAMAIFKKSAYINVPDEYTNYKFCGDWVLWISILLRGKVHISGKVLNYFRNHSENTSTLFYNTGLNYIEELNLLQYFRNLDSFDDKKIQIAVKTKYLDFLKLSGTLSSSIKKEISIRFLSILKINDRITLHLRFYAHSIKFRIMKLIKKNYERY